MTRRDFANAAQRITEALRDGRILENPSVASELSFFSSRMYVGGIARDLARFEHHSPSGQVLDFGCGTGVITAMLGQRGYDVRGVEITPDVPSVFRQSGGAWTERSSADATVRDFLAERFPVRYDSYGGAQLPYDDGQFDATIAYAVIEHVAEDRLDLVLREIVRTLKPGGHFAVFRCPRTWSWTERFWPSHERLLSESELKGLLATAELEVISFGRSDLLPEFAPSPIHRIYGAAAPVLGPVQDILDRSPLNTIAHNSWAVAHKRSPPSQA